MRRLSMDFIKPGMKVGRPIRNSSGQILLNAGVVLSEKYISRLKLLGLHSLYIDDGLLPDIQVDDVIPEETRVKAIQQVKSLLQAHSKSMGGDISDTSKIYPTINDIIDQLLDNTKLIVELVDIRTMDDYVFAHSVNVCVLALMTGISLGFERPKLFHLGMGALLHDIGKIFVPKNILDKPGRLTEEEYAEVKKHPAYGLDILSKNPHVSSLSRMVVYQHHERYNGEGYPQNLKDSEIHQFAQITGMVDMYDALTANRVYRGAFPPHEAYEMIAGSGNYLFDFNIIQPFLSNIAAYPAGTIVELSSGEIAVVVSTKKGFSLYPKVRLLINRDKNSFQETVEIDLLECRNVTICKVVNDIDFSKLGQELKNKSL
ncbi:HD-GYP domain-containing protein [Desulfotomaculum defluvii]